MLTERLWMQWAQAPWHGWLKNEPQWLNLFLSVALRLPQDVTIRLLQPVRPLILVPPVEMGRVIRINAAMSAGVYILQMDRRLLERPVPEAEAILAHEIAHMLIPPSGNPDLDDREADRVAARWGYREGLIQALQKDLSGDHPRLRSLQSSTHALTK